MISVLVEVAAPRGAGRRRLRQPAPSIREAVAVAERRSGAPRGSGRVVFPIDGEAFFAGPTAPELPARGPHGDALTPAPGRAA